MRIVKSLLIVGLIFCTTAAFSQKLPESYQTIFDQAITNFESIRTGNSITKGKNSLRVLNENRIVLRTEHKKKVKNLTFVREKNEEGKLVWIADNQLTIDMVNKYEEFLTEVLQEMLEYSAEKAKE
jgi:hypothetical protein